MEDELNLLDIYFVIKKRFKSILVFMFVFACVALVYVQIATKIYRATAVIFPLGGGSGNETILAQVASMTGSSFATSKNNSVDLAVVLDSRTLAERVALRLDLVKYYYSDDWDSKNNQWNPSLHEIPTNQDAALTLSSNIKFIKDPKTGVLTINVEDKNPKKALEINQTVLSELQKYLNNNTLTEAKRRRIFMEKQLTSNAKELLEAGKELGGFYKKNLVSTVSPVVDVNLELRDISKDYDSSILQDSVDDKTKELQDQKNEIEKKIWEQVKGVPQQAYLDYLVQKKQILMALSGLLSQQYEMAKMEEAKEGVSFLVIDEAILPKKAVRPRKVLIMFSAMVLSIIISSLYIFVAESFWKPKMATGD